MKHDDDLITYSEFKAYKQKRNEKDQEILFMIVCLAVEIDRVHNTSHSHYEFTILDNIISWINMPSDVAYRGLP
jgi:hypothetical protein